MHILSELWYSVLLYPLFNVLVRARADYSPKLSSIAGCEPLDQPEWSSDKPRLSTIVEEDVLFDVKTEDDDELVVSQQPQPTLDMEKGHKWYIFAMTRQIWDNEGPAGFYKGLALLILYKLLYSFTGLHDQSMVVGAMNAGWAPASVASNLMLASYKLWLQVPQTVFVVRSITSTTHIPWFSPQALLTPGERSHPLWPTFFVTMFVNPSVLVALFFRMCYILGMAYVRCALGELGESVVKAWSIPDNPAALKGSDRAWMYALFAGFAVLWIFTFVVDVLVLAPLDVATVRLALQRNTWIEGPEEEDTWTAEEGRIGLPMEDAIVRRRPEPYDGLRDCLSKIRQEEGTGMLYRGWWWTLVKAISMYT